MSGWQPLLHQRIMQSDLAARHSGLVPFQVRVVAREQGFR